MKGCDTGESARGFETRVKTCFVYLGIASPLILLVVLQMTGFGVNAMNTGFVASMLISVQSLIYKRSHHTAWQFRKHRNTLLHYTTLLGQILCFLIAVISVRINLGYVRPLVFFLGFIAYAVSILIEILFDGKSSVSGLLLKIGFLPTLSVTFFMIYPTISGVDPWRDLFAAWRVIESGHISPAISLFQPVQSDSNPGYYVLGFISSIVAEIALVTGLSLVTVLVVTMLCSVLIISLTAFLTTKKLNGNNEPALIAAFIASLVPIFLFRIIWPIPLMMSMAFLCVSVLLLVSLTMKRDRRVTGLLVLTMLTMTELHGAVTLSYVSFSVLLWVMLNFTKSESRKMLALISIVLPMTYWYALDLMPTLYGFARGITTWTEMSFYSYMFAPISVINSLWAILPLVISWPVFLESLSGFSARSAKGNLKAKLMVSMFLFGSCSIMPGLLSYLNLRYLTSVFPVFLSVTAGTGVTGNLGKHLKVMAAFLVVVFVFSAATSPTISPDFWEPFGTGSNPSLAFSYTYTESSAFAHFTRTIPRGHVLRIGMNQNPCMLRYSLLQTNQDFWTGEDTMNDFVLFSVRAYEKEFSEVFHQGLKLSLQELVVSQNVVYSNGMCYGFMRWWTLA